MRLLGEANDYVGKGMCGGEIIVRPAGKAHADFIAEKNSIIGNTCLYGATGGRLFVAGQAGERFAVRNSGVTTVVEGVGDHGCEYMTGGVVVVLGPVGENFAAGMTGGLAIILDTNDILERQTNMELVDITNMVDSESSKYEDLLRALIAKHIEKTNSPWAQKIVANFDNYLDAFKLVIPRPAAGVPESPPVETAANPRPIPLRSVE